MSYFKSIFILYEACLRQPQFGEILKNFVDSAKYLKYV